MHRYLLFAGDDNDPNGGWDDFICDRPTIEECRALCEWTKTPLGWKLFVRHKRWQTDAVTGHWLHIVDSEVREVVFQETSFKKGLDDPIRDRSENNTGTGRRKDGQGNSG